MVDLKKEIIAKIETLGEKGAAEYFGVSIGTVSNWRQGRTKPSIEAGQLILSQKQIDEIVSHPEPEIKPIEWEGRQVIILSPVYASFHPYTHYSLFANYSKYGPEKVAMLMEGMTLVYEARNILIQKWRRDFPSIPTAIMVDDDMIFPWGDEAGFNGRFHAGVPSECARFNMIQRMMSYGKDKGIVGASYYGRHPKGKLQSSIGFDKPAENDKFRRFQYRGLMPVDWVGTGCMKIESWVVDKMYDAIDAGKWPECKQPRADYWRGPFNPKQAGTGEDVSFCLRAKEIGIQTYLDASLICLHIGDFIAGPKTTTN